MQDELEWFLLHYQEVDCGLVPIFKVPNKDSGLKYWDPVSEFKLCSSLLHFFYEEMSR